MSNKRDLKNNIWHILIAIAIFLVIGAFIFSALEGWSFTDSFYFVTMTATTVGYGDITPTHTLSKIITILYSLFIIPFILYAFNIVAKYEVERVNRQVRGIKRQQSIQEEEMEKTERRIREQKKLIKDQQSILESQEKKLRQQEKINKIQEEEIEGHQRKIRRAEKEIKAHDSELEIVEDFVGGEIAKELKK